MPKLEKRLPIMKKHDKSIVEFVDGKWEKLEGVYK